VSLSLPCRAIGCQRLQGVEPPVATWVELEWPHMVDCRPMEEPAQLDIFVLQVKVGPAASGTLRKS